MSPALGFAWRVAVLGGASAGLAVSPFVAVSGSASPLAGVAGLAALALALTAPRRGPAAGGGGPPVGAGACVWLCCVALSGAAAGLAAGAARLGAIDSGALELPAGRGVEVRGFVAAVPTRSGGRVRVALATADGRLLVEAPEPVGDLAIGAAVRARGTARDPADWERVRLAGLGVRTIVAARRIEPTEGRRDGVAGALDAIRSRAEDALGRGTGPDAANLLRGFVLGADDRIDAATVEEFKRSGLAHLLAVSGQNVVLLAVLATVALAVLGVPLRARLVWVLALIAIYVPVAGAGPSIQRAGVMGAAGVVAALASRPRSRWYALLLAACVTLALDPRAGADVGWQLSFAAVAGILLCTAPIARLIAGNAQGWRRALAEGVALTVAATLATAPLMAHHFGAVSVVALPANVAALPAVAPVMWLGMLAAAAGQFAWLPVEPLTWLAGLLAGYIAQVAGWFAAPEWAQAEVGVGGPVALAAAYAGLVAGVGLALRALSRRRRLRPPGRHAGSPRRRLALLATVALVLVAPMVWALAGRSAGGPPAGLRITFLDVGQGDSILLEPGGAAPVLVDAGPAGADVAGSLAERGIESLGALVVTHPESDHDGGAPAVLERVATRRLAFARAGSATRGAARAAGTRAIRIAAGARLRSGSLRLTVLWPPSERLGPRAPAPGDPNSLSVVLLARWHGFQALLTGDAEAESAPIDPGAVDVLKVAHHGSEDGGLAALLERADPRLAVISTGAGNPFGHPAPATLATLADRGVPVARTDREGEVVIEVADDRWTVR
jgi:competence protein ComEC